MTKQIDRSVIAYAASAVSEMPVETCVDAKIRGQNLERQRKILEEFSSEGGNYRHESEMISEGLDLGWFLPEKAGQKPLEAPPALLTELQSATAKTLKSKLIKTDTTRYIEMSAVPKTLKYVRNPVLSEGSKSVTGRNCPACQRRRKSRPRGGVKVGHCGARPGEWREGVARGPLPRALA
jgi:hypothetical protein